MRQRWPDANSCPVRQLCTSRMFTITQCEISSICVPLSNYPPRPDLIHPDLLHPSVSMPIPFNASGMYIVYTAQVSVCAGRWSQTHMCVQGRAEYSQDRKVTDDSSDLKAYMRERHNPHMRKIHNCAQVAPSRSFFSLLKLTYS